ncbi:MAG: 4,5-DOPA dioxygenase extradiol [Woeseiaceae bacterium]
MSNTLPSIFVGHGSPLNAIEENRYTEAWQRIGELTPRPNAILAVSAHWFISNSALTISTAPRTIHDFGGFPEELFQVQYPAPGDPKLARRVQDLLAPLDVALDDSWGLDHGTWSVLRHMYPHADVPVVQLSIDASQPARFHFEIGQALVPLRSENVLIVGSGNIVHNLRRYDWGRNNSAPFDWALRFEKQAMKLVLANDFEPLIDYERLGSDATLSIPTPEHYLPLLYVLGSKAPGDVATFPVEGIEGGSMSMLAVHLDNQS